MDLTSCSPQRAEFINTVIDRAVIALLSMIACAFLMSVGSGTFAVVAAFAGVIAAVVLQFCLCAAAKARDPKRKLFWLVVRLNVPLLGLFVAMTEIAEAKRFSRSSSSAATGAA